MCSVNEDRRLDSDDGRRSDTYHGLVCFYTVLYLVVLPDSVGIKRAVLADGFQGDGNIFAKKVKPL